MCAESLIFLTGKLLAPAQCPLYMRFAGAKQSEEDAPDGTLTAAPRLPVGTG